MTTTEVSLPAKADVIIIGGGVIGCSIAYHLSKKNVEVVLLERKTLTCGTTWHAAGLVGQLRATRNLTKMAQYSTNLYQELEQSGHSLGFIQNGSISLAQNKERMEEFRRGASMGKNFGLEVSELSYSEIKEKYPLADLENIEGGVFLPKDGQINPVDLTMALASESKKKGAKIFEKVKVKDFVLTENAISKVITDQGEIDCKKVVIASGMWSRELGKKCGVNIPLHACEHFYAITEFSKEIPKNLPVLRVPDSHIYVKEDAGKLLIGAFEPKAKPWGKLGIPEEFEFDSLPNDEEHFNPILFNAIKTLPILENIGIQTLFNGPESFTPDDRYYLGKASNKKNVYIATGFNSIGIQSAGGVGKVMSDWIVDEFSKIDLWDVDVSRVLDFQNNDDYLEERTSETLGLLYKMHWPFFQYETARNMIQSPLHKRLESLGACFGETAGWERANWFSDNELNPKYEYSYGKQNWFDQSKNEHNAVRNNIGIFDQSSFAKIMIEGPDAVNLLNLLCVSEMNVKNKKIIYTQMLNENAGTESDLTVTRLDDEKFLAIISPTSLNKDYYWFLNNANSFDNLKIKNVTNDYGCISIMGPNSRKLMQLFLDEDISNESFPFGYSKDVKIKDIMCIINRITYVGELGYEIYIPNESLGIIFDLIFEFGDKLNAKLAGYHALNSLRMEKGYLHWGHDISVEENPFEAGVGFCVNMKKDNSFIGQEKLTEKIKVGFKKRRVNFCLHNKNVLLYHNEPIYYEGNAVGEITSGMFGHTLNSSLGMGYVSCDNRLHLEDMVLNNKFEIEVAGTKYKADASLKAFYDPERKNILI